GSGAPGEVLDGQLTVACGSGAVRLIQLQRAGKSAVSARDFLNGASVTAGMRFD
ncbi:MAG: methionyl-tRNA formyltransferase, partial [Hyphomicrobiales bacterium]|nr:methionyl-tRNA formyltransferase [Hyphomicrobiales bacterium]